MDDRRFFDFCLSQYRDTLQSAESLFGRHAFVFGVIVALAAATYGLSERLRTRWDGDLIDGLIAAVAAVAAGMVALSTALFVGSILRRPFSIISDTRAFHRWRESYRSQLEQSVSPQFSERQIDAFVAAETHEQMLDLLTRAEEVNHRTIERRLYWQTRCLQSLAACGGLVFVQALLTLLFVR